MSSFDKVWWTFKEWFPVSITIAALIFVVFVVTGCVSYQPPGEDLWKTL